MCKPLSFSRGLSCIVTPTHQKCIGGINHVIKITFEFLILPFFPSAPPFFPSAPPFYDNLNDLVCVLYKRSDPTPFHKLQVEKSSNLAKNKSCHVSSVLRHET